MSTDTKVSRSSAPPQRTSLPSEGIASSGDSGTDSQHSAHDVEVDQQVSHSEAAEHHGQNAVGWMLRVRSRNDELKKYFALPPSENFLDEFHCALRKRVLLQGRMYIFDNHVCFYSNVFGFVKKRVIKLKEIISVKRKTNFRFPNSIELEDEDGGKDFFTSFLSRDTAYKLIINSWRQACGGSKAIHKTTSGYSRLTPAEEAARRERHGKQNGVSKEAMEDASRVTARRGYEAEGSLLDLEHRPSSGLVVPTVLRASRENTFVDEEAASDGESEDDSWEVQETTPPPWGRACKLVLEADLPCTARQYYDCILSDRTHFFEDFHQDMGDRRISLSPWRRHEQLGHVRDLSFQAPIKGFGAFGKSHTQAYQTQRFVVYKGDTLVFETSQVMNDIPYGDCFTVDVRWELGPSNAGLHIAVYLDIPFSRKCMFKSMIEGGCYRQVQETCTALVAAARQVFAQQQKPSMTAINIASPFAGDEPQASLLNSMRSLGAPLYRPTLDGDDKKVTPVASARTTMVDSMDLGTSNHGASGKSRCGTCHLIQEAAQKIGAMSATTLSTLVGFLTTQSPAAVLLAVLITLQLLLVAATWWAPRLPAPAGVGAATGDAAYWSLRLQSLHSEMQLLQSRMDLVAQEVQHAMHQLQGAGGPITLHSST